MAVKTQNSSSKQVIVIGAGWAGCAAAVKLAQTGHIVTLVEASQTLGGRARGVEINGMVLDNGQHILLGAYTSTLALLKQLGLRREEVFLNLPLQMCYPKVDQGVGMQFVAPRLPAPLHLLVALLRAKGLNRADKLSLARFSTTARWMDWHLNQDTSVTKMLMNLDQTENLCRLMWNPLCIAALNTPPEHASAQVFLHVLRDSLGAGRSASDMLLPRQDLSAILPNAAATFIKANGGVIVKGVTVKQLVQNIHGKWTISSAQENEALSKEFDGIVVATNPDQASQLVKDVLVTDETTRPQFNTLFEYEPITTCYLQYAESVKLPRPFFALLDNAEKQAWGQFVFDRGQLHADQTGLLAVVISATSEANQRDKTTVAHEISLQLANQLDMPELAAPLWQKIITEKRATFACRPNLIRPNNRTNNDTLMLAGDYTAGEYPATLESAVRSGIKAAQELFLM